MACPFAAAASDAPSPPAAGNQSVLQSEEGKERTRSLLFQGNPRDGKRNAVVGAVASFLPNGGPNLISGREEQLVSV